MEVSYKIVFIISVFIIVWAMVGYPTSIKILGRIFENRQLVKDYKNQPTVTVMVVAHNEEKVIENKLNNILDLNYPKNKIKYLITSDNSTDQTNEIVRAYIKKHSEYDIRLFEVKERKGKTNAQNEAFKTIKTEYIVMTDANSILHKDSVVELMAAFTSKDISYVTGKLAIVNQISSDVSKAEASYWDSDLEIRDIESRIQTITAGNGALYACKTDDYIEFDPIQSHDTSMPLAFALIGRRAIANHDAIAYEKAGEVIEDEFGRKVRMNRLILKHIIPDFRVLNFFKYKWFTYFYFGHRTCRYLLWISHFLLLLSSMLLITNSLFYLLAFVGQLLFYLIAILKFLLGIRNKYITLIYYYCVTIVAQWIGVLRSITGKAKPFWDKAESTR